MCLLGKVERPGVSWGVLGCPGVIRLTPYIRALCKIVNKQKNKEKLSVNKRFFGWKLSFL